MYECPNCAANLKFDIGKQQLFCEHCETSLDPYSVEKNSDAEESQYFDATIYLCPQCGGQILSDDTTVATFCSYCGASTILTSRISKCKRPKYIIPFQKTKEDCKEAYKKMVRGAFFAPKEFKDANAIEQFRAIYMPYWICNVEGKGTITFEGTSTAQRGDYKIINYEDFTTYINSKYDGFLFDASQGFPDQLSTLISPFELKEKKPFTPSFLSGFYADTNDVSAADYCEIAKNTAIDDACERFRAQYYNYKFGEADEGTSLKEALEIQEVKEELAMLPVWFLAYRKKDRVAYGVINGQTGKVAVDLPIDIKKFIFLSLVLAVPIIALLNLFLVIKPNILLALMVILASVMAIIVNERTSQVLENQFYEDFQMVVEDKQEKREKEKKIKKLLRDILFPAIYMVFVLTIAGLGGTDIFSWLKPSIIMVVAEAVFLVMLALKIRKNYRIDDISYYNEEEYKAQWKKNLYYLVKPFTTVLLALIVLIINPVDDIIYYGTAIIGMGIMLWTMLDLIGIQNKLITRPLPQFNIRGGDEDAYKML